MTRRFEIMVPAALCMLAQSGLAQSPRPAPELQRAVREIHAQVSAGEAFDFVAQLHSIDRWQDFSKFRESAEYLQKKMTELGLRNIEIDPAPADGVSQFGWWTMPLAWDVTTATLELVEPAHANLRVLCDYRQEPASLIQWSGSTPRGGVTAEVAELRSGRPADIARLDVNGKMILVKVPSDLSERGALKAALYKAGAAGIISDYTENEDLRDGHYWVNAWGDMGWGFTKTSSPLVGFSITPRQGEYLRSLLGRGVKVKVHAVVDARYYSGSYLSVTGVIPGESYEEVLELGHGFELGAQDNSTGEAAMLEAIAAVNRAIAAGRLPRPRRSIRILTFSEDYGSSHYIATHMERMKRTVGAMHMDVPAGDNDVLGAYSFGVTPDVSRTYQNALVMRTAETYYSGRQAEGGPRGRGRTPLLAPYSPTADTYTSDPMIGVPTVTARGSSGRTAVHHNSEDTLDRVDPRSLEDLSTIVGAYLYSLASAGDADIPWLVSITLDQSYRNALETAQPYLERILAARNAGELGSELYWGLARINYNRARDEDAVLSTVRLASRENSDRIRASLDPSLKAIEKLAQQQSERLQAAADQRAADLHAPAPVKATPPSPDPRRAEAAHFIVRRKRFGPVTLDDLPLDQREGFPGFAAQPAPLRLLYWCDGKRTAAEVISLIELEQGPMNFDFVGYYKMLARHGYVDLIPVQGQHESR